MRGTMTPEDAEEVAELFFRTANTDNALPWGKLAILQTESPLSERQRCEIFLRVVSGDRLDGETWDRFVGAPLQSRPSFPVAIPQAAAAAFRAALVRVIEHPKTARDALDEDIDKLKSGSVIRIPFGSVGKNREHVVARWIDAACVNALSLFVDPERPFGPRVRRCAWEQCGRFAFVGRPLKPGQPRKHYCNAEHEREGRRMYERDRKADYRKLKVRPASARSHK